MRWRHWLGGGTLGVVATGWALGWGVPRSLQTWATPVYRDLLVDEGGRAQRWSSCGAAVVLQIPRGSALAVNGALGAAAEAWGDAPLQLALRADGEVSAPVHEDGVSSVTFEIPGVHCRRVRSVRPGDVCLERGMWGVTKLYTRALSDEADEIVEADVVFDRALLEDPARLYEIALHEFGHVFGLRHPRQVGLGVQATVMNSDVPSGAVGIGRLDRAALEHSYRSCAEQL